jgi:hypothetical protein
MATSTATAPGIVRTRHISFALGLLERMPDSDLRECFPANSTAEVREYLKKLRTQGLKYFPCRCEAVADDSSCLGWEKDNGPRKPSGSA